MFEKLNRHANKLMGLDGFLMKPRMATLGNEAALHGKSRSESADMPELNVKMFL